MTTLPELIDSVIDPLSPDDRIRRLVAHPHFPDASALPHRADGLLDVDADATMTFLASLLTSTIRGDLPPGRYAIAVEVTEEGNGGRVCLVHACLGSAVLAEDATPGHALVVGLLRIWTVQGLSAVARASQPWNRREVAHA